MAGCRFATPVLPSERMYCMQTLCLVWFTVRLASSIVYSQICICGIAHSNISRTQRTAATRAKQAIVLYVIKYRRGPLPDLETSDLLINQTMKVMNTEPSNALRSRPKGDHSIKMYQRSGPDGEQKAARSAAPKKSWMVSVIGTKYTTSPNNGLITRVQTMATKSIGRSNTRGNKPEPSLGILHASPAGSRRNPPVLRCMRQIVLATTPRYHSSTCVWSTGGGSARRCEANDEAM
mmetsp:Transcript_139477/g.389076  ORF Transcript_139477/g.389076 Transcript_139477/m.389076 type:complete len:235 (-) Transcript_139477:87-791(-)